MPERDLRPGRRGDNNLAQRAEVLTEIAAVAQVHAVALQALNGRRQRHAAQGDFKHVLDVGNVEAVTRDGIAVDIELNVVAAHSAFRKSAQRPRHGFHDRLDLRRHALQLRQVGAGDLNPHWRLDAGRQHINPRFDGHRPGVIEAGELDGGVHRVAQLVGRAVAMGDDLAIRVFDVHRRPLPFGLKHDGGFDHVHRRGVGSGLGPADLPEDVVHFREGLYDLVGLLEDRPRLGHTEAREGGGHVKQVAFVERRHEFRAEVLVGEYLANLEGPLLDGTVRQQPGRQFVPGEKDPQNQRGGQRDHRPAPLDDEINDRMVEPDEDAVNWVLLLGRDFATDEETHQDRRQSDREDRRRRHGVGLGEGQRLEHSARLLGEHENREERDRDHEQRVEQRRPHLHGGVPNDVPMGFLALVALHVLVGVLDHDDDGVHHGAYGDGDPAQGHDVGADALGKHDEERDEHGDRQNDDGHEGATQVHEKRQTHQRHHDAFLEQLLLQRLDGALDERAAVIGDGIRHVRR